MKPQAVFVTVVVACCVCNAAAGTLKAAAAEAISESKFEARRLGGGSHEGGGGGYGGGGPGGYGPGPGGKPGGHGGGLGGGLGLLGGLGGLGGGWNPSLHGSESFTGPTVVALALPIAIALIIALWIAAYNTLRSPPPQIGYNAGIVESAGGWGGNGQQEASAYVSGGYGWDPSASEVQPAASNLAQSAIVQAAASAGNAGVVATGRALDNLTHRVTRSIARQEKKSLI